MALEILQEIADRLTDLPERLAALWEGEASATMEDAEALGDPAPLPVPPAPDWVDDPALPLPRFTEPQQEEVLPAATAPAALAEPEQEEEPLAAPAVLAEPKQERVVPPAALPLAPQEQQLVSPVASWDEEAVAPITPPAALPLAPEERRDVSPVASWDEEAAPVTPPVARVFTEEELPSIGLSFPEALALDEPLTDTQPPATAADFDPPVSLAPPDPLEVEGLESVGGPAPETPGAGGSELSRMVALLERIAVAVEALERGGQGAAAAPESGQQRGYGQRLSAWADRQKARDFDAEESFPTGSPSVNVSSVAGLSGASSVDRGFGSGYRKRSSLLSGGQRQKQTSAADAKVFTEPGGHGR